MSRVCTSARGAELPVSYYYCLDFWPLERLKLICASVFSQLAEQLFLHAPSSKRTIAVSI